MSATPLSVVPEPPVGRSKVSLRGVSKSFVSSRGERVDAIDDISFEVAPASSSASSVRPGAASRRC